MPTTPLKTSDVWCEPVKGKMDGPDKGRLHKEQTKKCGRRHLQDAHHGRNRSLSNRLERLVGAKRVERWKRSRSWKGDWQRSDKSRQSKTRSDWALSFPAEAQDVVMGTGESASVAGLSKAGGSRVPTRSERAGRLTIGRCSTPTECAEQGTHEGTCVICPQEPCADEWGED